MPSIRAVETTFDDISRQSLSPVRRLSSSSVALRRETQNADYESDNTFVFDDNDDVNVYDDSHDKVPNEKDEYEPTVDYDYNKNVISDNVTERELNIIMNDNAESQNIAFDTQEQPTCSSWATALERQVREAELEYENTAFVDDSVKTPHESSKTYGKFVSIGQLGKFY